MREELKYRVCLLAAVCLLALGATAAGAAEAEANLPSEADQVALAVEADTALTTDGSCDAPAASTEAGTLALEVEEANATPFLAGGCTYSKSCGGWTYAGCCSWGQQQKRVCEELCCFPGGGCITSGYVTEYRCVSGPC